MIYAATDNGYVIRDATDVVYNYGNPGWIQDKVESLIAERANHFFGVVHNGNSGSSPVYPIHNWVTQAPDIVNYFSQQQMAYSSNKFYNYNNVLGNDTIYKSTDRGLTWTSFVDTGVFESLRVVLADRSYVWYTRFDTPTLLYRINHDGSGTQSFALALDADNNRVGNLGYNRIYLCRTTGNVTTQLDSIDITDPDVPVVTHVASPFGATMRVYWIEPLSNTIAIALVVNNAARDQGAIYRTTNAGVTWTLVVGMTANLRTSSSTQPGESGTGSGNNNAAHSRDEVWAGSAYPYLYHSLDAGLTWTLVTSTINLNDPALDFHNWTSLVMPARGQPPFATIVGAV